MSDQSKEVATVSQGGQLAKPAQFSFDLDVQRVVAMRKAVEDIVEQVLVEGEHYGVVPGTSQPGKPPKKALLQPGAEVLCQVFRLRPEYTAETREERPDFIMREVRCRLYNAVTGELVGEAIGSANSREEKYLAQTAARICPACGKATIIKGKEEFGGGWLCYGKKGGCGAKFADDDKKILDQIGAPSADKVMNLHHTIISIAQKRAFVKATRTATATSNIFTDEPDDVPGAVDDPDGHGKAGQHQTTTSTKTTAEPKASALDAKNLNDAMRAGKIGEAATASITDETKRKEAVRAYRLKWMNAMLEDMEQPKVTGVLEISKSVVETLTAMAKAGTMPAGWEE